MPNTKIPLVAVCGKFQPFHNEHLQYVLQAFNVGQRVIIGITNPDPIMTRHEEADPLRGLHESNPFTYYERTRMVANCLLDEGIDHSRFYIVPFPINIPDVWHHYIPKEAVFLITLYADDPWMDVRRKKLESAGIIVQVLWSKDRKGITGNEVRNLIDQNQQWEHLVPLGTVKVIKAHYQR
jgi:nicotinamide-nucleotide adenylyltransferase